MISTTPGCIRRSRPAFASWLKDRNLLPEALLERDPADVLAQWHDGVITIARIRALLGRAILRTPHD